jgi:hypothetical protein
VPAPVPLPDGVTTTIFTAPAAWAGVMAVIVVALTIVTPVAATPPKVTLLASVKSVPVIVTNCPPVAGPLSGEAEETVGAAANLNRLAPCPAPAGVVTVTWTVAAV